MTAVSRETRPLSLGKLLSRFGDCLSSIGGFSKEKPQAYLGVHVSLLPYLFLFISRLKTTRCVVYVKDFSVRQALFEVLSSLAPGAVFHLTRGASSDNLTGSDLHVVSLFHRVAGSIIVVSSSWQSKTVSFLSQDGVSPVRASLVGSRVSLVATLEKWGFGLVQQVDSPGTFARRGAVVDLFCYGSSFPLRLEYNEDSLRSARTFDPVTQKMVSQLSPEEVLLYPPISLCEKKTNNVGSLDVSFFSVGSSGPAEIYDVRPLFRETTAEVDLVCTSHGGFLSSPASLNTVITRLSEKGVFWRTVFCSKPHASRVSGVPVLDGFSLSHLPFWGSFSSLALGCFWVALDSVIALQGGVSSSTSAGFPLKEKKASLPSLPWGGPVVHEDLGIGLYRGLSSVTQNGGKNECVALEFKHGDLVHVPLERLVLISPHVGSGGTPSLTNLRSTQWRQAKQKAKKAAGEIVDQFVQLYGERSNAKGFAFSPDEESMSLLSESFPYSETVDQLDCLESVRQDMESGRPMDRLVCGDVGFGKTEIALRAAFRAVVGGKQVVLIAPTTILANQLYSTFSSRLAPLGVDVRHFSRFTPSVEARNVLAAIVAGTVDVVVGTHRLLVKDLFFPKLGLIIIDEEHRFGAKQKELLRAFRSAVDVLSMSATPIPRTLQFSLVGIRDISTIRTPPRGRLPITTTVELFNHQQIKSAVNYEVSRGGQVLFVHNNISGMGRLVRSLEELFPNCRLGVAHGKMASEDLERVMLQMVDGKLNLLVSTTIIEAGIDLENVNTILINNAHRYGLAQLYQMRGRVGRSNRQAYCYLLLPGGDISQDAHERLRTIQHNTQLGSGYDVALRDLGIRGGGNLFGEEQSGHLASVGFHLFCKIVKEAAKKQLEGNNKNNQAKQPTASLSMDGDALIPQSYVEAQDVRLGFYQKLAVAETVGAVLEIEEELRDRFGPLPNETINLLSGRRVCLAATSLPVSSIEISKKGATLWLSSNVNALGSLESLFEDSSLEKSSFVVVLDGAKTGIMLSAGSTSEALEAVQYAFESRLSPR